MTRFTEAVPLSLSSVAHTLTPLEDGVLDGLKTILQHTLWSSLSYARAAFGRNFSPVDLVTSPLAWTPRGMKQTMTTKKKITAAGKDDVTIDVGDDDYEIPTVLRKKHGFDRSHQRTALIYLCPKLKKSSCGGNAVPGDDDVDSEYLLEKDNWTQNPGILAKLTFLYASTGDMTPEELEVSSYDTIDENDGGKNNYKAGRHMRQTTTRKRSSDEISDEDRNSNTKLGYSNSNDNDDDNVAQPPKHVVMYRAMIEYRSLPATGKKCAVRAEELSMLSFGGSLVDDDVKLGALASLYDDNAKYVLEILGVRGKKYRLDLMDATLSDGSVPTLPSRSNGGPHDPFVKNLCVTVTDHEPTVCMSAKTRTQSTANSDDKDSNNTDNNAETETDKNGGKSTDNPSFALTKMKFSLEGNLRIPHLLHVTDLPPPNYYPDQIQEAFLSLRSQSQSALSKRKKNESSSSLKHDLDIVVGTPSGHRLLLDPSEAGRIYIHGRYVTTWGKDKRIGTSFPALFGMDLNSVPYWHGRITDYDRLMMAYATLWTEMLTDAKLLSKNIGGRLLSRLITGSDPLFVGDDEYDDDDEDFDDNDFEDEEEEVTTRVNTDISCLESQVMASSKCDPVGISAKALATQFQYEYGIEGYPCLAREIDWVKDRLPGRVPVAVPQRLIDVLRRGGYFDVKRTTEEIWFGTSRPVKEGTDEELLVKRTCELLVEAKCTDVQPSSIVFGNIGIESPAQKKGLVRINRLLRQYHVNEEFMTLDMNNIREGDDMILDDDDDNIDGEKPSAIENTDDKNKQKENRIEELSVLLGLYIAREHPDGNVMIRYMLRHGKIS